MNNTTTLKNDGARPDVDVALRDYFQHEMPHPWPAFEAPQAMRSKRPASFWSRYGGRMALAASIAVLLAGYLALSGYFPRQVAPTGLTPQHEIGMKDAKSKK